MAPDSTMVPTPSLVSERAVASPFWMIALTVRSAVAEAFPTENVRFPIRLKNPVLEEMLAPFGSLVAE